MTKTKIILDFLQDNFEEGGRYPYEFQTIAEDLAVELGFIEVIETCEHCNGDAGDWDTGDFEPCEHCGGTGKQYEAD